MAIERSTGGVLGLEHEMKNMRGIRHEYGQRWVLNLGLMFVLMTGTGAASVSPQSYRLGPNDIVKVQVYGEDDLSTESKVDGDGNINFPLLGVVHVAGKTVPELQDYLIQRLAAGYVRSPRVTASVFKHRNFYVTGEVKSPGAFAYEEGMTIQKALAMAGGLTEKAERADISVLRSRDGRDEIVISKLDALVVPDDTIVIAAAQQFYINGEIKTPGRYKYEQGLTIHRAITMAGGFTDKASIGRTKVVRTLNGKEQSIRVDLDTVVLPDDIIVVPRSFF
jgi:protein involved in polysaccharide export with SLBB domain